MVASPAARADPRASSIRALASVDPELVAGEPDLVPPSGADPLVVDQARPIGWTALDSGRGAVGLEHGLRFDLDLHEGRVQYRAESTVGGELVVDSWERCVLPFALASAGAAVLHAAAVADRHGVVAIAGESGAGKSTLRGELERCGYAPYADDAVPLQPGRSAAATRAIFLPFRPKAGPGGFAGARVEEPSGGSGELPLRAVVALAQGGRTELRRLDGAAAFAALLRNSYSLAGDGAGPPTIEELLAVAQQVPVFELRFSHTGGVEPATIGALLSVLRGNGLWGGREVLGEDRAAMAAAVPMAARYALLRRLARRLPPERMARLALAPRRPRVPGLAPLRPARLTRLRAAAALFAPGGACVERSLTLARTLADAGLAPEVVVGWSAEVREGHAWVELDGARILDDAAPERSFEELWRCDERARLRAAER